LGIQNIYIFKIGVFVFALERSLKKELVIDNVRAKSGFESDNIEFEKSVLIYIIVCRKKYVLRGVFL
jgi:hypothetical protein